MATLEVKDEDQAAAEADDNLDLHDTHAARSAIMESIAERVNAAYDEDNKAAQEIQHEDEDGRPIKREQSTEPAGEERTDDQPAEGQEPSATEADSGSTEEKVEEEQDQEEQQETQGFDPNREYEIVVDGETRRVKGSKIIDAGMRSLQKHDTADVRLDIATRLMNQARSRATANAPSEQDAQPQQQQSVEPDQEALVALAEKIQYGTREEAAQALKQLHSTGRAVTPDQVMGFVAQQIGPMVQRQVEFNNAVQWVQEEYKDLLDNPMTRQLFFLEENRARAPRERGGEGSREPYRVLYKRIGDNIRKQLNLPVTKASSKATLKERQDRKKDAPRVAPPSATSRLETAPPKEETRADVLNSMRKARRQVVQ